MKYGRFMVTDAAGEECWPLIVGALTNIVELRRDPLAQVTTFVAVSDLFRETDEPPESAPFYSLWFERIGDTLYGPHASFAGEEVRS